MTNQDAVIAGSFFEILNTQVLYNVRVINRINRIRYYSRLGSLTAINDSIHLINIKRSEIGSIPSFTLGSSHSGYTYIKLVAKGFLLFLQI